MDKRIRGLQIVLGVTRRGLDQQHQPELPHLNLVAVGQHS
jgi:hypothetical protein